jgi:TolB-like protein/tetratricopeptide (TPR) repeat protein
MFTDMVGYTALAQRDEALAIEVLDEHRRQVRAALDRHSGREVDTAGDAFLVEFGSALDAVACAAEIQTALRAQNARRPADRQVWLRIGIHLGDVIHAGHDLAGDAVNVASRLEPLAAPGGICISAQVHASVINRITLQFESLGTPALKNVLVPIEVFRVAGFGDAGQAQLQPALRPGRVAVLPLLNISQDASDDFFADGMTEEIIAGVSRLKHLRVIARTSVMRYKGTRRSIGEIGRELGVGHVVEGSVRKAGDRIRIFVQLVDTVDEVPRWSQEYDRELRDVFAIQSDIAERIAAALQEHVLGEPVRPTARTTDSPEAYVNYLRGRQFWSRRTEPDLLKSIEYFEAALQIDAGYARALSGVADSYASLALLEFMAPHAACPKAREAADRALALDADLAEAHTSLGLIKFQYDWDWQEAESAFGRAIAINPSYAPAHHFLADYLKAMGRFDEALSEIEKAQELDPLSQAISTGVGHVLYLSGQYDRAIEQYRKAVDLDPDFMMTHVWFGRPYLEKGMFDEAIAELQTAVTLSGASTLALAMLGHGLAAAGRRAEALDVIASLEERSRRQYVPSYWMAVIHNGFKDRDQVLAWMRKAFEERSSWLVWSKVEPRFAWLRSDTEIAGLLQAMKFP